MQRYPVRTSHRAQLTVGHLAELCQTHFGQVDSDGGAVLAKYGALARLKAWPEKKELAIEVTMDPKVEVEVAGETVRRYNRFLEDATGFSAKERAKRLRKSASGPADGS
ncbi:MAG: DUF5611 family protein [Thermoplasmata archaeon]|nr:DUF5611 family protein [Thermoplasmata archaeon]